MNGVPFWVEFALNPISRFDRMEIFTAMSVSKTGTLEADSSLRYMQRKYHLDTELTYLGKDTVLKFHTFCCKLLQMKKSV